MKNIFQKEVTDEVISRINKLTPDSRPLWGKMSVAQMLAHCSVTYEYEFENIHKKPNPLMGFFLRNFVKGFIVNEKPFKKNIQTSPAFIIKGDKDFNLEKKRLTEYLIRTQQLGQNHFHNKEQLSFGKLTGQEWNNMFYKHLDHHLNQFGV
jgi:hypothetical protein